MGYLPTPTVTQGGQKKALTSNDSVEQLLSLLLIELQKMNTYLSLMTGETVEDHDVS